jgi:hypothetical protein
MIPKIMRTAIVQPLSGNGASGYEPLSSVWEGSDGDLLEAMFKFYATIPPEPILDATHNVGRFWKGSERCVVSMDIDIQAEDRLRQSRNDWRPVRKIWDRRL